MEFGSEKSCEVVIGKKRRRNERQRGSIAIEYIIVCSFGILVSLATVAYVGKVLYQKVESLSQKTGIESHDYFNFIDSEG